MESTHSHMCRNYMAPVPLEFNSGLFHVFEDYRKLRAHKEHLEAREHSTLDHARKVTAQWHQSEIIYEAEIRHLELLIAHSTNVMDRLMKARRRTVLNRKRPHRKTISTDHVSSQYKYVSSVELDDEIRSKTQQALLHRPSSPSKKMVALSRRLTSVEMPDDPTVHLDLTEESLLPQKVKSELDFANLRNIDTSIATSGTVKLQLTSTHDLEAQDPLQAGDLARDPLECEAFVALKELGVPVARRKGLEVFRFIIGLMTLLICVDSCQNRTSPSTHHNQVNELITAGSSGYPAKDVAPRPPSRKPRSLSHTEHDHTRRRHFSFEPGDDQMREIGISPDPYDLLSQAGSTDSGFSASSAFRLFDDGLETDNNNITDLLASRTGEIPRPTMIPSPVQTMGRVRRENSTSGLQSVFVKNNQDDRRNSRTSIQTAFREEANVSASTKSKGRSTSSQNVPVAGSPLSSKERLNGLANRQSNVALAAARAAEARSSDPFKIDTRLSKATSSSRKRRTAGPQRTETPILDPTPMLVRIVLSNAESR